MRLWTIHPEYLDARGLTAAWREGLLARKVLSGKTRGYTRHPQLIRFRGCKKPVEAVNAYLQEILKEANRRGYRFDGSKITPSAGRTTIPVTRGQLDYEWRLFLSKIRTRDSGRYRKLSALASPEPHPLFKAVAGGAEPWEKVKPLFS